LQVQPHVLRVHCCNHRMALGVKDGNAATPWVKLHQDHLTESYSLLSRSCKNNELYKLICIDLGRLHLAPKKLFLVRWYGFQRVVAQQWQQMDVWRQLYKKLASPGHDTDQPAKARASALLDFALDYQYVLQTAYLFDVLTHLQRLSATLQTCNISFERVGEIIKESVALLKTWSKQNLEFCPTVMATEKLVLKG
jgi:hypothetical protein